DGRQEQPVLRVGAAERVVAPGAAARRLEAEELDLVQLSASGVREERVEAAEAGARDHAVDADFLLAPAQRDQGRVGAREAVEAPYGRVGGAHSVERDVDLAEEFGDRQEVLEAGEAARRQVRDQAAGAGVAREVAEPGQHGALAAAEREVEDARVGERVDGALPLLEPPLAGGPLRRGAGVAAL